MAKKFNAPDGPFFVGDEREMQVLATWIDDFERAAVCRISSVYREPDFTVDLQSLNKVLANGPAGVECLNPVDADKLRKIVGALQRDVAASLAGGLDAVIGDSRKQRSKYRQLRVTLDSATPYLRWLGVQVRQELATTAEGESGPRAPRNTSKSHSSAAPKRRGRKKADYATVKREATLAEDWKRAREAGRYKHDFAKDKDLTVKQLDALLDRVAKRKRTSE